MRVVIPIAVLLSIMSCNKKKDADPMPVLPNIIYSDLRDSTALPGDSILVDIDGDHIDDIKLYGQYQTFVFSSGSSGDHYNKYTTVKVINKNVSLTFGYIKNNQIVNLKLNDPIRYGLQLGQNATMQWYQELNLNELNVYAGYIGWWDNDITTGYIGICMSGKYGWIKLTSQNGKLTILEQAYNNNIGQLIYAGQKN